LSKRFGLAVVSRGSFAELVFHSSNNFAFYDEVFLKFSYTESFSSFIGCVHGIKGHEMMPIFRTEFANNWLRSTFSGPLGIIFP
jgi:hypothetical protein